MDAMNYWQAFSEDLCMEVPTAYASARKIHTNKVLEIPWKHFKKPILKTLDLESIGYAGWSAKEKQLDRNYWNDAELTKLNAIMRKRSSKGQSCVTARFGGPVAKSEDSMGYCMQTISLNYVKRDAEGNPCRVIEVHYRATELLKKFVADMIYLQEKVLPFILEGVEQPTAIRFHFMTIDVNPLYVNIIAQHLDIIKVMKHVMEKERRWARVFTNGLFQLLTDGKGCQAYATLRKQYDAFQVYKESLSTKQIKELCKYAEIDYATVKPFC